TYLCETTLATDVAGERRRRAIRPGAERAGAQGYRSGTGQRSDRVVEVMEVECRTCSHRDVAHSGSGICRTDLECAHVDLGRASVIIGAGQKQRPVADLRYAGHTADAAAGRKRSGLPTRTRLYIKGKV